MPARILIADDSPVVRSTLRQLLSHADREIAEAEDGADAVAKALECRPDIAILDLAMPAMDGLTAAREIGKHLPQTALVMCTMHWSSQLQVEAQKSGIRSVVAKSNGGEIVTVVQELLSAQIPPAGAEPASILLPPNTLPPPSVIESVASAKEEPVVPAADDLPDRKVS
jgi:DNA-binding NarL/FixJ family response regulator